MNSNSPDLKIVRVTPGKLSRYYDHIDSQSKTYVPRKSTLSNASILAAVPAELTIYLKQIRISKSCRSYINQQCTNDKYLKIKWNFNTFEHFIQSPEAVGFNTTLKLDFSAQYKIDIDYDFIKNVTKKPVVFEVFAVDGVTEIKISSSELHLSDFLDILNVKQSSKVSFSNDEIDKAIPCIAILDLWYRVTCNKKDLKDLYHNLRLLDVGGKESSRMFAVLDEEVEMKKKQYDAVAVTASEIDQFADNLLLVLNRNKVLKTSQSEINTTLRERVRWLRYEANWKQTLQEHAILHGKNPLEVSWRQWREEDTTNVRLRTYDNLKPTNYKPELAITIKQLYFLEGSTPLRKDSIKKVYVEFCFMGQEGPEMETPFSLPKGTVDSPTKFNWTKTFNIDINSSYENCKILASAIRNNDIIKFMVISEPVESFDTPIQTCEEIGYAEVPLDEIIQLEENSDSYEYEIVDFYNPIAVVGYITIKFDGLLAMRKMALNFMAPNGYKLFM